MTRAYKQTRSCICKVVLRCLTIVCSIPAIVIPMSIDMDAPLWPFQLVGGVAVLWSLIDLVLLCVRHTAMPVIGIILDGLFTLGLGGIGGILAAFTLTVPDMQLVLLGGSVLFIVDAVFYLVLFVFAIVALHRNRRDRKTRYRPDSYTMNNGTAESLIPMKDRPVANGYSAF